MFVKDPKSKDHPGTERNVLSGVCVDRVFPPSPSVTSSSRRKTTEVTSVTTCQPHRTSDGSCSRPSRLEPFLRPSPVLGPWGQTSRQGNMERDGCKDPECDSGRMPLVILCFSDRGTLLGLCSEYLKVCH